MINKIHKDIPAQKVNNLQAFYSIHTNKDMYNLTHPGGISTEEINNVPVDRGEWNILTLDGLSYNLKIFANDYNNKP